MELTGGLSRNESEVSQMGRVQFWRTTYCSYCEYINPDNGRGPCRAITSRCTGLDFDFTGIQSFVHHGIEHGWWCVVTTAPPLIQFEGYVCSLTSRNKSTCYSNGRGRIETRSIRRD